MRASVTAQDTVEVYPAGVGFEAMRHDPAWAPIRGIVLSTGLMAVQVTLEDNVQPFLGIVDCGATESIMNRAAARALGDQIWAQYDGKGTRTTDMMGKETVMPMVPIKVCVPACALMPLEREAS